MLHEPLVPALPPCCIHVYVELRNSCFIWTSGPSATGNARTAGCVTADINHLCYCPPCRVNLDCTWFCQAHNKQVWMHAECHLRLAMVTQRNPSKSGAGRGYILACCLFEIDRTDSPHLFIQCACKSFEADSLILPP